MSEMIWTRVYNRGGESYGWIIQTNNLIRPIIERLRYKYIITHISSDYIYE